MMRSKIIDINNFETYILADAIEESQLDFEYTRDGKGGLINPKEFSHNSGLNGKIEYNTRFVSIKISGGVPISYVIIKDTSSTKNSEHRYMQIMYQASLDGKMFTRESRKVLDILKETTLGTDTVV